jgi:hypothetical protein
VMGYSLHIARFSPLFFNHVLTRCKSAVMFES